MMANALSTLHAIGNRDLLRHPRKLAFFCSNRCPGEIILKVQDWANGLAGNALLPMSGFHTPVEREALRILLRSRHPLAIFPARSLENMRIPAAWKAGIEAGAICVASGFPPHVRRATAQSAAARNRLVASLADAFLIPYATPGGNTSKLLLEMRSARQPPLEHTLHG